MREGHLPVLVDEVLASLDPRTGSRIADCTVGGGGHADRLLEASSPDGRLLGLDAGRVHPATRTFQALRIAVNRELEVLGAGLAGGLAAMRPGGRMAVISYHSGEDRIVKRFMVRESRDCVEEPLPPVCTCGHRAQLRLLAKGGITPGPAEIRRNRRARSARLRVAE